MLFKTTENILKTPWLDELWDDNWMDGDTIQYPPRVDWDYKRPMVLEDVDIWEVLCAETGNRGIYAAWLPYAEFYLVMPGSSSPKNTLFETYYGSEARIHVMKRAKELNIRLNKQSMWVDPKDMWKYEPQPLDKIIIP